MLYWKAILSLCATVRYLRYYRNLLPPYSVFLKYGHLTQIVIFTSPQNLYWNICLSKDGVRRWVLQEVRSRVLTIVISTPRKEPSELALPCEVKWEVTIYGQGSEPSPISEHRITLTLGFLASRTLTSSISGLLSIHFMTPLISSLKEQVDLGFYTSDTPQASAGLRARHKEVCSIPEEKSSLTVSPYKCRAWLRAELKAPHFHGCQICYDNYCYGSLLHFNYIHIEDAL